MSDMRDVWREHRKSEKARKSRNLKAFNPEGWTKHTDYHYSRTLLGDRLDYWPSRNRFMWRNKVMCGDVEGFIRNRETDK